MRQIKFRGKDNGHWVYGDYIHGSFIDPNTGEETPRHIISSDFLHDVDPNTIGQFTGLLDKNGKEIYEGDIVQCGDFVYQVVYEGKRHASFGLRRSKDLFMHYFGEAMEAYECTVIGNIHDIHTTSV